VRPPRLAKLTVSALIASSIFVGAANAAVDPWAPSAAGPRGGEAYARTQSGLVSAAAVAPAAALPLMTYWGGAVMTTGADITPIYWGKSWGTATFAGDKMTGLTTFYGGVGGSKYLNTNTEYTQTVGTKLTPVLNKVTARTAIVDTLSDPTPVPNPTLVLAEVAATLKKAKVTPVSNGYYPVYGALARNPAASTSCGWHSHGLIGTVRVKFAFFFNLDGDAGCDPKSTIAGTSQGLAALANISAHELSEALTDPELNAWYDTAGNENSDKCAWSFSATPATIGGRTWKLQGNWSNAAYTAGTGYIDAATKTLNRGCIDTK